MQEQSVEIKLLICISSPMQSSGPFLSDALFSWMPVKLVVVVVVKE